MLTAKFPYFIKSAYGLCLCIYVPFLCANLYVRHHHANKQTGKQASKPVNNKSGNQKNIGIVNICQIKQKIRQKFSQPKDRNEKRMKLLLILLFNGEYFQWWGFFLYYFYCEARIIFGVKRDNTNFQ